MPKQAINGLLETLDEPTSSLVQVQSSNDDIRRRTTTTTTPASSNGRKKQFRWGGQKDLVLVQQVEKEMPFGADKKVIIQRWNTVATTLNKIYPDAALTYLSVRRAFENLLTAFRKDDYKRRNKSGVEEEVTDIEAKLGNLLELIESLDVEAKEASASRQKKEEVDKSVGEEIREAALSTVKKGEKPAPVKRSADQALVELFEQKEKSKTEIKLKEIDLKEKQLKLDTEKFEFSKSTELADREERKARFNLEQEERASQLATQKMLLNILDMEAIERPKIS